jgi:hypothetical protein
VRPFPEKAVIPLHLKRISLLQIGQFYYFACHNSMHLLQNACKQGSIISLILSRQIPHSPIESPYGVGFSVSVVATTVIISFSFISS